MIVEAVRVGCENSPLPLDSTLNLSEQYPVTPDDQGKGVEDMWYLVLLQKY